jgi:hypothetical protein
MTSSDLVRQNEPPVIVLCDSIILLAHRIIAQVLIAGHEPARELGSSITLFPSEKITSVRITTIASREIEFSIVRDTSLHFENVHAMSPAGSSQAFAVRA